MKIGIVRRNEATGELEENHIRKMTEDEVLYHRNKSKGHGYGYGWFDRNKNNYYIDVRKSDLFYLTNANLLKAKDFYKKIKKGDKK